MEIHNSETIRCQSVSTPFLRNLNSFLVQWSREQPSWTPRQLRHCYYCDTGMVNSIFFLLCVTMRVSPVDKSLRCLLHTCRDASRAGDATHSTDTQLLVNVYIFSHFGKRSPIFMFGVWSPFGKWRCQEILFVTVPSLCRNTIQIK